jgi:transcriptional regulator EpsA
MHRHPMDEDASLSTSMDLDILLLNVEVAIGITRRTEFFSWVQGVFQGAIAHDALICGLAMPNENGLRFEWLGSYPIAAEAFAELASVERGLLYRALGAWQDGGGAPLIVAPDGPPGGGLLDLLRRRDLRNMLAHGVPGLDGRPACFFVLCRLREPVRHQDARMIAMLVPYLYTAWLRANCGGVAGSARRSEPDPALTRRELEILEWMQKGKSNGEMADILGISHLTVKNHVQKVLRKLGANNRTQAVAKGITLNLSRGSGRL